MLFRQLFDKTSSTYTYLIASAKGREALVIDPVLENVERYIQLLKELDLKLVKVIDTHIHADHISGIAELRDQTNCVTIIKKNYKKSYFYRKAVSLKLRSLRECMRSRGISLKISIARIPIIRCRATWLL